MPVIEHISYSPPLPFKNGHINTIFPFVFRKNHDNEYNRVRLTTPDDDFIDIDKLTQGSNKLAILCHGLEGSSSSKYIIYTARIMHSQGWDVICMNYRGCSGEMNRQVQMYHSGFTNDLHYIIKNYANDYKEVTLVGFSLGGNMILKYLGDDQLPVNERITSAIGISVPCDLHAGALHISRWQNKMYDYRFLVTLKEKVRKKHMMFPDQVFLDQLPKVKNLFDFDDLYTAPLHGFKDAADYYAQSNCKQFLKNINIPTLIINALDDPFLPESSYPYDAAYSNDNLLLLVPKYGGHVGFVQNGSLWCWEEEQILAFADDNKGYRNSLL